MRILVVDDEAMQRDMLKGFLEKQGYDVVSAENGKTALNLFSEQPFQLVLLDHRMPDLTGDEVLAEMKEINPLLRAIMITAYGSVDTAVKVMKLGADDFLEKPVDLFQLLEKVQMIEQCVLVKKEASDVTEAIDQSELPIKIIGEGAAMQEVLSLASRIAPTPWNVLIRGETGTGKELVSRLIHLLSPRKDGPFIVINCGAIPENLFESELFGHEKGAFTGAATSRKGRFELAQNGTIFLDEIGELPLGLQPKLLRTLQERRISRVGSEKEIEVDTRVLAATNRDLNRLTTEGQFREDLYYRLKVLEVELPPLNKRKEDIPTLVEFFLDRYGLNTMSFDEDAMTTMIKYPFPGNVRELEHVIQRIVTLVRGSVIRAKDLPVEIRYHKATEPGALADRLEAVEREMLLSALEKNDWVQTKSAESLGISERVLRYKMKKFNLQKR